MREISWKIVSESPEQTLLFGEALGKLLAPGDVVALEGDLGAGKTVLTKGIARGLGIRDRVTSPTFTLINEYRLDTTSFYHVDCYRLGGKETPSAEAIAIGLEEIIHGDDIVVIEWAAKVRSILPDSYVWIEMRNEGDTSRSVEVRGMGDRGAEIAGRWREAVEGSK